VNSCTSGAPAAEDGLENARKRSRITDPPAYAAVWVPDCGEACNVLANKTSFVPVCLQASMLPSDDDPEAMDDAQLVGCDLSAQLNLKSFD
jgi:hypothetical protein